MLPSPDSPSERAGVTPRLLLMVADPTRREALKAQIGIAAPAALVEELDNVLDAIMLAARRPPHLLLLDYAIDGAAAPALITNLTRIAPHTEVMVFDDLADAEPRRGGAVRPWSDLPRALHAWLAARPLVKDGRE